MISFACKTINIVDIIRCAFDFTKTDYAIFEFLFSNEGWFTSDDLAKKMKLDVSTIQRSMKKLVEKKVVLRRQENLEKGGFFFTYASCDRLLMKKRIIKIVDSWTEQVKDNLDRWQPK